MQIDKCRLCYGKLSNPIIQLPDTPLANEFVKAPIIQNLFPLQICVCENCQHYQLNECISSDRLFSHYLFVAGTSTANREYFQQYAYHILEKFHLRPGSNVLEIASNDGILLKEFLNLNMSILGIDPAKNIVAEANKNGIPTIAEFFTNSYADKILNRYGQFQLIVANNVMAHLPDIADVVKGVKKLLSPRGIFVFEVSYFLDVCEKNLFDTIYAEHQSYHHITPLINFFNNLGMSIFDVERISNHGGSIRIFVCKTGDYYVCDSVEQLVMLEQNIQYKVLQLSDKIQTLKQQLNNRLNNIKQNNKSIAIYGCPAKSTTLLYSLDINPHMIDFAVDDAPLKQGTFTPGKHIPVLHPNAIYDKQPGYILILAWNFSESIMANHPNYHGTWLVPLPEWKEYTT